jgi:O-antigen/teichoic acid export membrane protein
LLDFGGQSYIGNLLSIELSNRNHLGFQRILSEAVSFYVFFLFGVFALIVGLLAVSSPILPNISATQSRTSIWLIIWISAVFPLSVPGGVYFTAYRASGLYARGMMVGNIARLTGLAICALVLLIRVSPGIYAFISWGIAVLHTLFVIWDTHRCIPDCGFVRITLGGAWRGRRYLRGSVYFWLLSLAQTMNIQGVLIIIAAIGTPVVVAIYSTHRLLASISGYIGQLLQSPLWPELTMLWAQKRLDQFRRISFLAIKINTLATGLVALSLWFLGPKLYAVWTGRVLEIQPTLLAVLLIQGVLAAAWSSSIWGLLAVNLHKPVGYWSLLNALVTLSLGVILMSRWGVTGMAVASLIGDLICGLAVFPFLAARQIQLPIWRIYRSIFGSVLALTVLVVCARLLLLLEVRWAILIGVFVAFIWVICVARFLLGKAYLNKVYQFFYGMCQ